MLQTNPAAEAPAVQLTEHARAILADDARLGIQRNDPVLESLAKGSAHAVPCLAIFFGVHKCPTKLHVVVVQNFPE